MNQSFRILIAVLIIAVSNFAQRAETFDIASFQPPNGWARNAGEDAVRFSIEDKASGTFCLITLFKSVPGLSSPKENFDSAWSTIVKETVTISNTPQMFPADTKGEWQLA